MKYAISRNDTGMYYIGATHDHVKLRLKWGDSPVLTYDTQEQAQAIADKFEAERGLDCSVSEVL